MIYMHPFASPQQMLTCFPYWSRSCCYAGAVVEDLPHNSLQPRFAVGDSVAVSSGSVSAGVSALSSNAIASGIGSSVGSGSGSSIFTSSSSGSGSSSSSGSSSGSGSSSSVSGSEDSSMESEASSESSGRSRLPLADLLGEPPKTALTDKQVDAVARAILKEGREDKCKKGCDRELLEQLGEQVDKAKACKSPCGGEESSSMFADADKTLEEAKKLARALEGTILILIKLRDLCIRFQSCTTWVQLFSPTCFVMC